MPLGALYPSKFGLMNKHIVKHIVFRSGPVIFVVDAIYPQYTFCYTDVVFLRILLSGMCVCWLCCVCFTLAGDVLHVAFAGPRRPLRFVDLCLAFAFLASSFLFFFLPDFRNTAFAGLSPGATVSEVLQGFLRWLNGDIPRGGAGIALAFCPCIYRLHHSRRRRVCSGGLVVASLKETQGLLTRFDCVYFRLPVHHSRVRRGCSGGLL